MIHTILLYAIAGEVLGLTGIWGVRYMLKIIKSPLRKKIQERMMIDVPQHSHFVREGDPEQNISFRVDFTRPSPSTLQIIDIAYKILYDDKVVQQRQWSGLEEIKGDSSRIRIDLLYYPMESSLGIPPTADKWGLKGTATIDCMYGRFTKDFSSVGKLSVSSDSPWEEIRNRYNRNLHSNRGIGMTV